MLVDYHRLSPLAKMIAINLRPTRLPRGKWLEYIHWLQVQTIGIFIVFYGNLVVWVGPGGLDFCDSPNDPGNPKPPKFTIMVYSWILESHTCRVLSINGSNGMNGWLEICIRSFHRCWCGTPVPLQPLQNPPTCETSIKYSIKTNLQNHPKLTAATKRSKSFWFKWLRFNPTLKGQICWC